MPPRSSAGFTLLEIMVVMVIIGVPATLVVPPCVEDMPAVGAVPAAPTLEPAVPVELPDRLGPSLMAPSSPEEHAAASGKAARTSTAQVPQERTAKREAGMDN